MKMANRLVLTALFFFVFSSMVWAATTRPAEPTVNFDVTTASEGVKNVDLSGQLNFFSPRIEIFLDGDKKPRWVKYPSYNRTLIRNDALATIEHDGTGEFKTRLIIKKEQFTLRMKIYYNSKRFFLKEFNVANPPPVQTDCAVEKIEQLEDFGLMGKFKLTLKYSDLPAGTNFVSGQSGPNQEWVRYSLDPGTNNILTIIYPNGEFFEFTLGTTVGSKDFFIDPSCSALVYPAGGNQNERRLRALLGEKKFCSKNNTGDSLVTGIENLGNWKYRVYVDFTKLPIANYRDLFVVGQEAPNDTWVDYPVSDNHPCYSIDVTWMSTTVPFKFTLGVVREDGVTQYIDPTLSKKYFCDGHICLPLPLN